MDKNKIYIILYRTFLSSVNVAFNIAFTKQILRSHTNNYNDSIMMAIEAPSQDNLILVKLKFDYI